MEFRQLKYFILVAEEKSFIKASKKSFISPQALSKAIQNLEEEFQGPLFERKSSGVEMTSLGMILFRRSKQIIELIDLTYSELNFSDGIDKKIIHLGIPYSILDLLNLNELFEFQNLFPNYSINITEVPDKIVQSEVYYNYLDIGIVGGRSHFKHFDAHMLLKSNSLIAMHKENPFVKKKNIYLGDLRDEFFITATKDYNVYDTFIEACENCGFTPRISQMSGNIDLIKQFVQMGQGIYPCPDNRTYLMNSPDIVLREIEDAPPIFEIYLLTKNDRELSKPAASLRDYIIKITTSSDLSGWSKEKLSERLRAQI
ncbi:MAG: LysR family transcriptional regulator [Clostridiales Family XIII bacterium]|jgi:LysR family hydrogen peroxide-inducible transcriptional activator|nr:LysR family transcriptional regulator [Clostridiales Family XIII bacterium]